MLLKFLIVDDSKAMQTIVKRILFGAGYAEHDFHFCDNGEDAIREIIKWQPDVVLLDWHMPGITGLQVLKKVQELKLETKIGLITAEKNKTSIAQAKAAGAMFVVNKPFTIEDLQESLIPTLAGVSPMADDNMVASKDIIFPSCTALSNILSTITGTEIKVEKVKHLDINQLSLPCKIVLYGDNDKQVKSVQVLDSTLNDRLAEAFASSVYKNQAFDDKLFAKALLKSLTIVASCFHDIRQGKELSLFKTYSMPKLVDKMIAMDKHPRDERLDLKFTFDNQDVCYSILYLENS